MIKRYQQILQAIQAAVLAVGRKPETVKLIAVSKTHPFEKIHELYQAGQRDFGENYVQELIEKAELAQAASLSEIRWHFIGHLQTNKVKSLLPWVHTIHAVNSLRLAQEIEKRAEKHQIIPVFLEVNIDHEETKSGILPENTANLAAELGELEHVILQGLMCIPNPESPAGTLSAFQRTADLEKQLRPATLGFLSMGMTSDFSEAIRAGATHLRIGSAIFGERAAKESPSE